MILRADKFEMRNIQILTCGRFYTATAPLKKNQDLRMKNPRTQFVKVIELMLVLGKNSGMLA